MEKVYLLENDWLPNDIVVDQIRDFIAEGFVEYDVKHNAAYQVRYYKRCMADVRFFFFLIPASSLCGCRGLCRCCMCAHMCMASNFPCMHASGGI